MKFDKQNIKERLKSIKDQLISVGGFVLGFAFSLAGLYVAVVALINLETVAQGWLNCKDLLKTNPHGIYENAVETDSFFTR